MGIRHARRHLGLWALAIAVPVALATPRAMADTITGTAGDDALRGTRGPDTVRGGAGDDTIRGRRGPDFIAGGRGDVHLHGGPGADEIWDGLGRDVLYGGNGPDFLGGNSQEVLLGGPGNDHLQLWGGSARGGDGNDHLRLQLGRSTTAFAGSGSDRVRAEAPYVEVVGEAPRQQVSIDCGPAHDRLDWWMPNGSHSAPVSAAEVRNCEEVIVHETIG